MARKVYVTHYVNGDRSMAHLINTPRVFDAGYSKQANALRVFMRETSPVGKSADNWYYEEMADMYEITERFWRRSFEVDPGPLPMKEHASVFDFFESVGWDHPKRQFKE